jgi:ADP-ribose pyrophosphatase YjhB (NUDIX family)
MSQESQMRVKESVPEWYDDTGKRVTRMPDAIHLAASGIVVNEKGEILLQKRADNGQWGLPSGYVDIGESVEHGAIREIWEETGIHTQVNRLVGIYSDPQHNVIAAYPDGSLIQFAIVVFECEYLSSQLRISDESTDIGYFPPDNLPDDTVLCDLLAIKDALEDRERPFIR